MAMVITTFSHEQTRTAQLVRQLLEEVGQQQMVLIVPHGLTSLSITADAENEFIVYSSDDHNDLDAVRGFENLEDCWEYAKFIAEAAGLTENDIDADVQETE